MVSSAKTLLRGSLVRLRLRRLRKRAVSSLKGHHKPFSVVLFDGSKKAHPDIFNSLLQILEDGRLTDSPGRVVDFKNTVIIMTTNLRNSRHLERVAMGLGFGNADDEKTSYERMKAKVNEELKNHFRPEFLNRIDDIIVFHQLTEAEIVEIVDLSCWRSSTSACATKTWASNSRPRPRRSGSTWLRPSAGRSAVAPNDPA